MGKIKQCIEVAEHWGNLMPIMATEELAECIQAISKVERKPEDKESMENLVAEMGDVFISLMALQYHYGIGGSEVSEYIDKKLNKKYD